MQYLLNLRIAAEEPTESTVQVIAAEEPTETTVQVILKETVMTIISDYLNECSDSQ